MFISKYFFENNNYNRGALNNIITSNYLRMHKSDVVIPTNTIVLPCRIFPGRLSVNLQLNRSQDHSVTWSRS